jgi:hypothetical protein
MGAAARPCIKAITACASPLKRSRPTAMPTRLTHSSALARSSLQAVWNRHTGTDAMSLVMALFDAKKDRRRGATLHISLLCADLKSATDRCIFMRSRRVHISTVAQPCPPGSHTPAPWRAAACRDRGHDVTRCAGVEQSKREQEVETPQAARVPHAASCDEILGHTFHVHPKSSH